LAVTPNPPPGQATFVTFVVQAADMRRNQGNSAG
jgi:hypothetical protein